MMLRRLLGIGLEATLFLLFIPREAATDADCHFATAGVAADMPTPHGVIHWSFNVKQGCRPTGNSRWPRRRGPIVTMNEDSNELQKAKITERLEVQRMGSAVDFGVAAGKWTGIHPFIHFRRASATSSYAGSNVWIAIAENSRQPSWLSSCMDMGVHRRSSSAHLSL